MRVAGQRRRGGLFISVALVVARDREHQLGLGEPDIADRHYGRQRLDPAVDNGEVQTVDEPEDRSLGRGVCIGQRTGRQQLLDRLLMKTPARQLPSVGRAQLAHRRLPTMVEQPAQILTKPRMAAQHERIR